MSTAYDPLLSHTFILASQVVAEVLTGKNLSTALEKMSQARGVASARELALTQELCYGVFRYYGLYEALLQILLNKTTNKKVTALLLVALHRLQIRPESPHVTVDQAVKAAVKLKQAKALVNAVLRHFLRNKETLLPQVKNRETVHYQHQQWWIDHLKLVYPQTWQAILEVSNTHPPLTLRVNHRLTDRTAYQALFEQKSLHAKSVGETGLILEEPVSVDKLPGFYDGLVSVQDLGAQYAAPLLDIKDGMRVLDACAAPGGKTGHILELAKVKLTALDESEQRLKKVKENLARLGFSAKLIVGDATKPKEWWDRVLYQRILADVPCSASGIVRRHPDIKWLRRKTDIAHFAQIQQKILGSLWQMLAPNGKLLYVTCSIFPEENALQVARFLKDHSDARRLSLIDAIPATGQLLPSNEYDGFFYALLQKKSG